MTITRETLWKELKAGTFRPVYVLHGEETLLRDIAADTIASHAFGEGDFRDFNDDTFSLTTPDNIRVALSAAEQLPMMAARRVVRITEVRVSTSSMKDSLKEDSEEAVSAYLNDPSPSTIVIFVVDELNGTRKLGKLLKAQSASIEFKRMDTAGLEKWASDIFSKAEAVIEPAALRLLADRVGNDVRRLSTESEKLITASSPEGSITVDMVRSMVRDVSELNNFTFVEELLAGRRESAVTSLGKLLDDGGEPLALLGTLSWKYREEAKRSSGAKGAYADRINYALQRIAECDLAIKSSLGGGGPAGSRRQLEMLVCELAG